MEQALSHSQESAVAEYFSGVFAWMFAGLAVSGMVAYAVAHSQIAMNVFFGNPIMLLVLVVAQLAVVILLAARITKMSPMAARAGFLGYAALLGITLSYIFLAYTSTSIIRIFFITASMFFVMAIIGYVTKKDLTGMGGLLLMGLIGIIIASVVNIFLHSNALQIAVSYIGIAIFLGLTAYDVQKIKGFQAAEKSKQLTIMGALALYLDFINIFLFLLRLFGNSS
jgi:FtsH-binding integral membrane protein